MLDLTNNASDVIRSIAERPELPRDAGLRIASESPDANRLTVAAAGQPEQGDQIVEKNGARVFLPPEVAAIVDDKVLDAHVGDQGKVEFSLSTQ
jgi:Fe-S cluster assembly iron-binding protein IscA